MTVIIEDTIEIDELTRLDSFEFGDYSLCDLELSITERISDIDDFLAEHQEVYRLSQLQDILQSYTVLSDDDFEANNSLYPMVLAVYDAVVSEILPIICPVDYEVRAQSGNLGFYETMPAYNIIKGSQEEIVTTNKIQSSDIFTKIIFVIENKATGNLRTLPGYSLNELCLSIVAKTHHVPFLAVVKWADKYNNKDIAQYIADAPHAALTWVIESLFFDDYKASIDRYLGACVTNLFSEVISAISCHGCKIDGIDPDNVYSLQEFCKDCEELDNEEKENSDCGCSSYEDVSNIWSIEESGYWTELTKHGAMTYETDSMYLYAQADHSGIHYDTRLRKAWLTYLSFSVAIRLNEKI